MKDENIGPPRFAAGGFIPPSEAWGSRRHRLEKVGRCPRGHDWYRIDGSVWVEHISRDAAEIGCMWAVRYRPEGWS